MAELESNDTPSTDSMDRIKLEVDAIDEFPRCPTLWFGELGETQKRAERERVRERRWVAKNSTQTQTQTPEECGKSCVYAQNLVDLKIEGVSS